jgi:hypothetical protein
VAVAAVDNEVLKLNPILTKVAAGQGLWRFN